MRANMKTNRLATIAIVCLCKTLVAQPWAGIIDPSRAITWSNAGVPGGVPNRTTICATLSPGSTSAQINSAIASCPANQVVFLSAGTYTLSGGITFGATNNVTLRGAGPTQTILQFTSPNGCGGISADVCVQNSFALYDGHTFVQPGQPNAANWTGGYAQGASQITLTGVGANTPRVGTLLILDQANDVTDTGGVLQCDSRPNCSVNGGAFGRVIGGVTHSQVQVVRITAINGSTYSINPSLYANNWRADQNPGAWWNGTPITGAGIENMTLDHSASNATAGVSFYDAYQCWFKNVRSLRGNRDHVLISQSEQIEVRDSYFFGTQNGAEASYGIEPAESSDGLFENNIFDQVSAPFVFTDGSGMVVSYNFSWNNIFTPNATWLTGSAASHDAGNHMNLFEGNYFNQIFSDNQHGGSPLSTFFRNWIAGNQPPPYNKTEATWAFELEPTTRAWNIVGNVLGTPGYHNNYETSPAAGGASKCNTSIYTLGWSNVGCLSTSTPSNDLLVRSTLLRWGNYDTVHGAVQWNSSEIPTTAIAYAAANAVPANHSLPNSFYRSTAPSFWGSMPWPPIGPDVTGGAGPGGFAYANPAQVCYNSTTKDSNGILLFDPTACYSPAGAAAPTALTVIVR